MKPPIQPAQDLVDLNVQIAEIQVTLEFTQETCKRIERRVDQTQESLQNQIQETRTCLEGQIKETRTYLEGQIKETRTYLEGQIKETRTCLEGQIKETRTYLEGQIKETRSQLEGQIKEQGERHEQSTGQLQAQFNGLSHKFDQLSVDVKNIISWKDRAIGIVLAISCLCTTGISLLLAIKSLL
jgi:chromosome segregation ATPase